MSWHFNRPKNMSTHIKCHYVPMEFSISISICYYRVQHSIDQMSYIGFIRKRSSMERDLTPCTCLHGVNQFKARSQRPLIHSLIINPKLKLTFGFYMNLPSLTFESQRNLSIIKNSNTLTLKSQLSTSFVCKSQYYLVTCVCLKFICGSECMYYLKCFVTLEGRKNMERACICRRAYEGRRVNNAG